MENKDRAVDEKNLIVEKSPLVKKFLNPKVMADDAVWKNAVVVELEAVTKKMADNVGNYIEVGIWPQNAMGVELGIFPDGTEILDTLNTCISICAMGYELGTIERCELFQYEIVAKLRESGSIASLDEDMNNGIDSIVFIMLKAGAYWRLASTGKTPEEEETPDVFSDFYKEKGLLDDLP